MTYPPQPGPYGPPGGYGQQYPGYPGYPQQQSAQPQQYPGQPEYRGQFPNQPYQGQPGYGGGYGQPGYGQSYPDQQGGYGQPYQDPYPGGGYPHQQPGYGMPPGDVPPPPEPPKRGGKTGLVVGITLAVVLLAGAAVAATGFWAPGFFRDDAVEQDSSLAADTSPGSAATPQESAPPENPENTEAPPKPSISDSDEIRRITEVVVAGINNRDADTVKPVSCDPSNERQADYDGFPDDLTVSVSGEPRINGSDATVPLTLRRSESSKSVVLTLRRPGGGAWCASGITSP